MNYDLFLLPFLLAFAFALMLLVVLVVLGKRKKIVDSRYGSDRHQHVAGVLRFGGIAMIVSFVIAIFLDKHLVIDRPLLVLVVSSLLILFFGVIDDVKQLSWKLQLFFQIALVVFLYYMGVRLQFIGNPLGGLFVFTGWLGMVLSLLVSVIWIVFIMNAINWIDGIDGVAGGVTFIGGVTIFLLSLRPEVNQPPVAIICAILVGTLAAFLLLNFNPSVIMAGTSGAMFMGFILAVLAIFAGAKIATTLLVMSVPIVDALWVIFERWRAGVSVFSSDRRHLHFKLLELGWSQRMICLFYYIITSLFAFIALNTQAFNKLIAIILVAFVMLFLFLIIRKGNATILN